MANRIRTNRNEFHLNDKEQYILDEKFKLSGMKSKSAFLRKLILYGYVYKVNSDEKWCQISLEFYFMAPFWCQNF